MADVFVNFPSVPVGYIRGDIDYELENSMLGWGMVSGGGAGLQDSGFFVDRELDMEDRDKVDQFIAIFRMYLRSLPARKERNLWWSLAKIPRGCTFPSTDDGISGCSSAAHAESCHGRTRCDMSPNSAAGGKPDGHARSKSVLKYRIGDTIELTEPAFVRLCEAVLADIEGKYS